MLQAIASSARSPRGQWRGFRGKIRNRAKADPCLANPCRQSVSHSAAPLSRHHHPRRPVWRHQSTAVVLVQRGARAADNRHCNCELLLCRRTPILLQSRHIIRSTSNLELICVNTAKPYTPGHGNHPRFHLAASREYIGVGSPIGAGHGKAGMMSVYIRKLLLICVKGNSATGPRLLIMRWRAVHCLTIRCLRAEEAQHGKNHAYKVVGTGQLIDRLLELTGAHATFDACLSSGGC